MKILLTPAQMYTLEKAHFDNGMSSLRAMENAAAAFVDELSAFCGSLDGKQLLIACGSGNNGGDGYAIARLSHELGARVSLLPMTPIDQLRGDALINAHRAAHELKLPCVALDELESLHAPDIWVDALFGIGLNRPMPESYRRLVSLMQKHRSRGTVVASVDVPSGLNAETGRIEGFAVHADLTVTFQYAKTGHYLLDGMDCTGRLAVRDIGFQFFYPDFPAYLIESEDFINHSAEDAPFPHRRHNSHKGTYGHLLVVAGSFGMTGAAMYAAHAALRTGAGLVSIACPRSIVPILQTLLPAAMCIPLPEKDGALSGEAIPFLKEALRGKSAVVVGPGLSTKTDPGIVRAVLECSLPAVVDADALNLIALHPALKNALRPHHIITPHPGEAKRLCPNCTGDLLHDSALLCSLGVIVLLKGAASVIRYAQSTVISASGSPGMATGGSGDVLSGIIGALLASGLDPRRLASLGLDPACAAYYGSELHGRCGELAEKKLNPVSMTASDLIDQLPSTISELYQ